jgi:hypothetical protein
MEPNMEKHVRIISKIMMVLGVLYLVAVGFLGLVGLLAMKNQTQTGGVAILPLMLTATTLLPPLALIGVCHILTARAFQTGAKWARIALWILAILNLGNVPLGTAFGTYAIWVLMKTRQDVKQMIE